jgi:hypothetical protein
MKKIGEGWQYSVYDLNNGRVLKKFHGPIRSNWVILKTIFPFRHDRLMLIPDFSRSMKKKALVSFEIIRKRNISAEWIGNPKFLNPLDFEQDKARPLHEVFANSDTETIKAYVDQFIVFNKKLLEAGIIDKSFNITKNFGLNARNEIILIDIGELLEDPEKIKAHKQARVWNKDYVAGCIKNEVARDYFVQRMDENFGI